MKLRKTTVLLVAALCVTATIALAENERAVSGDQTGRSTARETGPQGYIGPATGRKEPTSQAPFNNQLRKFSDPLGANGR